jgi:PBP1b-binding outer membrane lipoprotein LpoB
MFFATRRLIAAIIGGVVASGLLSGCVSIDPKPTVPTVAVTAPSLPPIPVDTSKSFEEQVEELKTGFAKVYCPVRNTPLADALADEGKRLWNEIASRAQGQGVAIPGFDPGDPKMCQ